ncbi:uncharacterized protein LOC143853953 [Tasmannia lanceolata]|uniref:uncharacterized protein LOC143853953 n=1 Tax=Tasmannia lanceolata TaxID=3420 RepID=UPI00406477DD
MINSTDLAELTKKLKQDVSESCEAGLIEGSRFRGHNLNLAQQFRLARSAPSSLSHLLPILGLTDWRHLWNPELKAVQIPFIIWQDRGLLRHLKEEIELLINRGYLRKYVKDDDCRRERKERSPRGQSPRPSTPPPVRHESRAPASPRPKIQRPSPNGVINTITRGPTAGGTSSSPRKAYARRVNVVHTCNKKTKIENEISFSDADLDNLILPHDDALVITMFVANWELKKILVDNGSLADILYYHALKQMVIGDDRLRPANSDLFRFSGEVVKVEGQIELPVLIGESPH